MVELRDEMACGDWKVPRVGTGMSDVDKVGSTLLAGGGGGEGAGNRGSGGPVKR